MTTTFGNLDLSDILQFVNEDGRETYSFRILNSSSTQSQTDFENLHLIKLPEDNGYLAYIIQWQPHPDWYVDNSYIFNLKNFSGIMNRYDLDYNILDSKEFIDGIVINGQDDNYRTMDNGCDVLQYTVCVYDCDHCSIPSCYEVIEISCTSGGGGDGGDLPDPIPGDEEEGGTGTHLPGGSTPGGTTGTGTYVPGGNGTVVAIPPKKSEILTNFGLTLTLQETVWVNKETNKADVEEIIGFLLEHCQSVVVTEYTCEEAMEFVDDFLIGAFMEGFGDKPVEEYDDKCEGIQAIWDLGTEYPNNLSESNGVLTTDGAILVLGKLPLFGTKVSGLYEYTDNLGNITTYYQYPAELGAPARNYEGMILSLNKYFIPISSYIHSHTECLNSGGNGLDGFAGPSADQDTADKFDNISHFVLGCGAIGQVIPNGDGSIQNITDGTISEVCDTIN
ncbi:hypothetical protein [Xanthomarina gelatinilytica]|uniref:hypothetical protein n=1 Tax=Xanthomarina gelatinilytica TaxID=1137281 RepID=UPI003AA8D7D7